MAEAKAIVRANLLHGALQPARTLGVYLALVAGSGLTMVPFLYLVLTSLKPRAELLIMIVEPVRKLVEAAAPGAAYRSGPK